MATNATKMLTWNEFFVLKKKLNNRKKLFGIPGVFAVLFAEGTVLSMPIFDPTFTVFGLDPVVFIGLSTIAACASGYYGSSILGNFAWRKWNSNIAKEMDLKQKNFYDRITKYRANVPPNPTQLNFSFDFYGEKIGSVADYRSWLRKQFELKNSRKFNL